MFFLLLVKPYFSHIKLLIFLPFCSSITISCYNCIPNPSRVLTSFVHVIFVNNYPVQFSFMIIPYHTLTYTKTNFWFYRYFFHFAFISITLFNTVFAVQFQYPCLLFCNQGKYLFLWHVLIMFFYVHICMLCIYCFTSEFHFS